MKLFSTQYLSQFSRACANYRKPSQASQNLLHYLEIKLRSLAKDIAHDNAEIFIDRKINKIISTMEKKFEETRHIRKT